MEPRGADGCFLGDVGFWVERTPVHEAAQRGETRQLQQLIENGACVNQVTVDSITPLHMASLRGQAQCVQLLLAAGAQVSRPAAWAPGGVDETSSRGKEAWE
ncbi:Ankyrin repeat and SOCS box protein 13 [Camelus dromedarius]|uniref:Ankyrin repeat and SOCS box protein 13 n=1 Tax=Camelus dromedarius TaxID=9838 RepID=A0A5N4C4K3_CAMDR|nr:Ankyrin repeat and SOCS box protein 13 [Camelus dromedarius]